MTPSAPGHNLAVVIPDAKKAFGYAVKSSDKRLYNLLLIPAPVSILKKADARITGVECPRILQPDALNLWHFAWEEAKNRFKGGTDLMLGINAKDGRQQDQLHIHLTAFHEDARKTLNGLKIPTDPSAWNTSLFVVMKHVYRILHVPNLDTNLFELVHKHVATTGKNNDMFQQALAVVSAPNNGYYVLNTQGKPGAGQPEHDPELRHDKEFGTPTIDTLMISRLRHEQGRSTIGLLHTPRKGQHHGCPHHHNRPGLRDVPIGGRVRRRGSHRGCRSRPGLRNPLEPAK